MTCSFTMAVWLKVIEINFAESESDFHYQEMTGNFAHCSTRHRKPGASLQGIFYGKDLML